MKVILDCLDWLYFKRLALAQYVYGIDRLGHDCLCDPAIPKDLRNKLAGLIMFRKWFHRDNPEEAETLSC